MLKKALFQLHWFFGITGGLVLALMGITGATVSFQDELLLALNPQVLQLERQPGAVLTPAELVSRLQVPAGQGVARLWVSLDGEAATRVLLTPAAGQGRGELSYVNPYTGEPQGEVLGQDFFNLMLQLHRFLAIGETGQQITGACTLMLVFFCLSGLYLRWPRKALDWRTWLTFDWAKKGRAFNWDLHSVAGTWCLVLYLLSALTGLSWSYEWYSKGLDKLLADAPAQQRKASRGPATSGPVLANYEAIWASARDAAGPGMNFYNLRMPMQAGQPVTFYYLLKDSPHDRAINQILLDPATGRIDDHTRYADKSLKAQLLTSLYALHVGSYFGLPGRILLTLSSLAMPLFFITGWLLYLDRRRKKRQVNAARQGLVANTGDAPPWLIGFASQSGQAEQLAWQTASQLQDAGVPVQVRPLAQLQAQDLRSAQHALFVVSTFGDGEAPDSARGFERQVLGQALALGDLKYAVLALGDRQYAQFCGFARRLHHWLMERGGQTLFAPVEVDNADANALRDWQQQLDQLTGRPTPGNWQAPRFEGWRLAQRECLNPGSSGAAVYRLGLVAPAPAQWLAGDLVEVLPCHGAASVARFLDGLGLAADSQVQVDGLPQTLAEALGSRQLPDSRGPLLGLHAQALVDALVPLGMREYSIASIASDGLLELIVRQAQRSDGSLGLGSGWLTAHAPLGTAIKLRLRRNSGFHLPPQPCPLILLGNGTGIAGLRSLLKARIIEGQKRNWLLFGERQRAHDFYCREELQGWLASGDLARLDLAFSRDQADKVYVQDRLRESATELRAWLADGAAIYICGSLQGMAAGVDQALHELLGSEAVVQLIEQGRYRRDVY